MDARGLLLGLSLPVGDDNAFDFEEYSSLRFSTSGDIDSTTSCFSNKVRLRKTKLRLSKMQAALLDRTFNVHTTLNLMQKHQLARELKLTPRQVEVWFQNRRARMKLKQTEIDCDLLKKLCETLRDENRRLHKELQELKANLSLTLCSSCCQTQTRSPFVLSLSINHSPC